MSDALLEEPKGLGPEYIYVSGSAVNVRCANCHETTTSGSWRRGWELGSESNANLCNKCGQRWVKLNKAIGREIPTRDQRHKPSVSRSTPSTLRTPASPKKARVCNDTNAKSPTNNTNKIVARIVAHAGIARFRSRLRSENTDTDGSDVEVDSPRMPMVNSRDRASRFKPSPFSRTNFLVNSTGYCIQKFSCGKATYALFWVVEQGGMCQLVAVGEDVRGSGHFTYRSCPGLPSQLPPLRCTNRNDVVAWLKSSFSVECVLHENIVRPPKLSLEQLQSAMGNYGGSQSPIIDFVGSEMTAPPLSTCMNTQGIPDTYGSSFGYINQGRASMPPLQDYHRRSSTSSHHDRGAKVKPFGSRSLQPAHSAPCDISLQFRCASCGMHDHSTDECPLGCVSPPTLIHDNMTHPLMEESSLDLNHEATAMLLHEDDSPMQGTVFDSFLDGSGLGSPTVAAINSPGVVNQPPPKVDGADAAAATASACGHSSITAHACNEGDNEARRSSIDDRMSSQPRQLTAEATQTFLPHPHLLQWVAETPSQKLEETFQAWKAVLSGHISESPSTMWTSNSIDSVSKRWVPPLEALAVLQQLGRMETSLALLEKTRISPIVASLRSHPIREIAEAAEAVVSKWRNMAVAALETATTGAPMEHA